MFENHQLDCLPQHQSIEFKPLADNALLHTQLSWLLFYLPLMAALAAVCFFNQSFASVAQTPLIIGLPIILLLSLIFNVFSVRLKGVAVRSHDIAYQKGVIWRQVTILPLARIQHTEIHRGPLERKLGLASLRLYSAGGMSADLSMSGLSHADCKDMRQFIQDYTQHNQASEQSQNSLSVNEEELSNE
ncbi:PH domain-containing protein [Pseudoalteromonas shioyasakiensis]|uniref:PH domain-containing protein n=1 Tax=Pseudoalteromonas shioyasakiensis TaxID=1190813 RepID=UPI002118FCEC|nr:PH domain-containing protein [Pseudoalteromonas shioyasakiensis]